MFEEQAMRVLSELYTSLLIIPVDFILNKNSCGCLSHRKTQKYLAGFSVQFVFSDEQASMCGEEVYVKE